MVESLRPSATSLVKGGTEPVPLNKGDVAQRQGVSYIWQPDISLGSGVYLVRARFDYFDKLNNRLTDRSGKSVTKMVVYLKLDCNVAFGRSMTGFVGNGKSPTSFLLAIPSLLY